MGQRSKFAGDMSFLDRLLGRKPVDVAPAGVFPSLPVDAVPASARPATTSGEISFVSIAKPVWSYGLETISGLLPPKSGPAKRIAFAQLATPGLPDLRERLARPEDELGRLARGLPLWLAETMYFSTRYTPIAVIALLDYSRHVLIPQPWSRANIQQIIDTAADGLDYVVSGMLTEDAGGERSLTLSLWDVAKATERKTWSVRWRPETADRELAAFQQHFRLFMEWTEHPSGNGIAYAPSAQPARWIQAHGACVSMFLAEKVSLNRDTIALTPEVIDLVAEQAVTGEAASLAWLTLSNRARRLGLVGSVPAVQLLPTERVKAAGAALA